MPPPPPQAGSIPPNAHATSAILSQDDPAASPKDDLAPKPKQSVRRRTAAAQDVPSFMTASPAKRGGLKLYPRSFFRLLLVALAMVSLPLSIALAASDAPSFRSRW